MPYQVAVKPSALKDLSQLPASVRRRARAVIDALQNDPRPRGTKKLVGTGEELWRVRVGQYRIIYAIDDAAQVVTIRAVRPRQSAYR